MLILGIESATSQVGCALGGPEGVLASVHTARPRRHAESLAPQIRFIVDQAGVALSDVDVVALDVGPGLFTGLRVGITTGVSLAWALGVPVVTTTSLELLAFATAARQREVMAVVDARRGEVFYARYRHGPTAMTAISSPAVARPAAVATSLAGRSDSVLVVGEGVRAHLEVFQGIDGVDIAPSGFDRPSAAALVALAGPMVERGELGDPSEVAPLYLREPDAEAKWDPAAGTPP